MGGFFKVVLLGHLLLPSAPYRVATPYVVAPEWYGDVYTLRELGLDVIIVVVLEWRFIIKVYAQPERRLEPAWRGIAFKPTPQRAEGISDQTDP